jgi:hypothetical protein
LPYRAFIAWIRRLFGTSDERRRWVADALAEGRQNQPANPMTDSELARAIREFREAQPSLETLGKLGSTLSQDES